MTPPCKNCKERSINCHATCEKYGAYSKEREEIREIKQIIRVTEPVHPPKKRHDRS